MAVDSVTNKVYVTNEGDNNVTVIDGATNSTTNVGLEGQQGPFDVAVNLSTNQIYVTDYLSNSVTVIDGATDSTTTTLASSLNPSTLNANVKFTATVTENASGTSTPTGAVTFMDGPNTLCTGTLNGSGVATCTTSSLAVGQHSITAFYDGNVNNAISTSAVLTQTVNAAPPDFALTSNPTSKTITAGQSAPFTLTVTPQGSFTTPISLSCTGLPALAACTFSPTTVTPNASTVTSTLTITTTAQTASLASPFGRQSSPLYAIWLVLPAMLLGTAGMAAPKRRKLLSYCLVFLLVSGCLLQVACSGASNGGSGGGGGGTPSGSYTITVTGAAGSTQHAAPVTLIVQ